MEIKTALLAYGLSGKVFHVPFLQAHKGFRLLGAWERSSNNIEKDFPNTKRFETLEQVLASEADLVIVNTPIETHFEYAKKCLLAGKNVLVEKAFTTNSQEAKTLIALAEEKNLLLTVYQNRRWDSDFLTVQKMILSNKLQNIKEVEMRFERFNPVLSPKTHKETQNPGAGVLMDLGSHIVDQMVCLFGKPNAVFGQLRKTRQNTQVFDFFQAICYYENHSVLLKSHFFASNPGPAYVIFAENGSFQKSRADVQEDHLRANIDVQNENWGKETESDYGTLTLSHSPISQEKIVSENGNYMHFFDQLYLAITQKQKLPVNHQDAIWTMEILDAIKKSFLENQIVKF